MTFWNTASKKILFVCALSSSLWPGLAEASGMYVTDRGVRPLGRGGAFVAGADDLGAAWYNPAGLSDAKSSVLADFSWVNLSGEFTRQTQTVDALGIPRVNEYPTAKISSDFVPIPTLGASLAFGKNQEFVGALALMAPQTPLARAPENAASRYLLVSLQGSVLVMPGLYLAYKPIEQLRVGMGLQVLTGSFQDRVYFSASPPGRLIAAPEDPAYDAYSQLKVGPIFAPSANFGGIFEPDKHIRLGASAQLPFIVNAPAEIDVRLPTAAPFDRAAQTGKDAHVRFKLPPIVRVGAEYRGQVGQNAFRVELAYVREFWSVHESIDVRPDNLQLTGIAGFPSPFGVAPISIPRKFEDANSFRLGGELSIKLAGSRQLDLRAGASYDTSAVPKAYVSPLTIDADKLTPAIGAGFHLNAQWRIDAVFAHTFMGDVVVPPGEAGVPRVNPVQGNPTQTEAVNGGRYSAQVNVIGLGANYRF